MQPGAGHLVASGAVCHATRAKEVQLHLKLAKQVGSEEAAGSTKSRGSDVPSPLL